MKLVSKSGFFAVLWAFMLFLFSDPCQAQQQKPYGMQSIRLKPVEESKPSAPPEEAKTEVEEEPYAPLTPLPIDDALVKVEDLEKWDHLDEAALSHSQKDVSNLIHIIESDRGAVPPQGLFLAAKSLADKNMMEQAAVYFFVGQLRLSFDMQRWPAIENADDLKRKAEDDKKSPEQAAPNRDAPPRIENPHTGIERLAASLGQPIIAWALKDPQRFSEILDKVKSWDAASPYAYLPEYDLTEPVAFEKWERILKKVRDTYFKRMSNLAKAMERIKN